MLGMPYRNETKLHPFELCKGCQWHAPYNTQRSTKDGAWLQISLNPANPNWVRVDSRQLKIG